MLRFKERSPRRIPYRVRNKAIIVIDLAVIIILYSRFTMEV